jgi:hypothetical protein
MIPSITRPGKNHFSESEAAVVLGVSVEELRALIQRHILKSEEDAHNVATTVFQPSDLLILRMILGGMRSPQAAASNEAESAQPASAGASLEQ